MKVVIKQIKEDKLIPVENMDEIRLSDSTYVLGIDASTTTTGLCIMNLATKTPEYSVALHKEEDEKNIRYKVRFKKLIEEFLELNSNVKYTIYEEPHIQYVQSAKVLLPLSTSIEEIVIENEPTFDYLDYKMYGNKVWKKQLLGDKLPVGTDKEKAAVALEVENMFSCYKDKLMTQDEKDAFGLAYIRCREILGEIEFEKLAKQKPFKYEVEFIGADSLDEALEGIANIKYPKAIIENGATVCTLQRGEVFDQKVYDNMAGEDKLLIVEFMPSRAGNIVLRHKLSHINHFNFIYAVIWRKSRKKVVIKK